MPNSTTAGAQDIGYVQITGRPKLDERDVALIVDRLSTLYQQPDPRQGDWIDFADGVQQRVAHVWTDNGRVQTTDGGSFHLGEYGGCSFSGSLDPGVHRDTLTMTDKRRFGSAWIFHHDHACARNGVSFRARFRVFTCSLPSSAAKKGWLCHA